MNSCEIVSGITALACALSKDKTSEEIGLLASIFAQLGDTLATIAVTKEIKND